MCPCKSIRVVSSVVDVLLVVFILLSYVYVCFQKMRGKQINQHADTPKNMHFLPVFVQGNTIGLSTMLTIHHSF